MGKRLDFEQQMVDIMVEFGIKTLVKYNLLNGFDSSFTIWDLTG